MYRPFLYITSPLVLGIILSYYFSLNILFLLTILAFLLLLYIVNLIRDKSNIISLFLLFLFLGAVMGSYQLDNSILKTKTDKTLILKGVVDSISFKDEDQEKYTIIVEKIQEGNKVIKLKEKTILKILGRKNLQLGDEIVFEGILKEPMENTNPNLYNYKLNLLSNKIYTTINIRENGILDINREDRPLKYTLRDRFEKKVASTFNRYLNENNSSLMKSIVLGEYSYLEEEDITKYRELGLAHILAVSGLHIGIIAGFIVFILSRLGVKRSITIMITLTTIWFYGFLIGFPPSLLRANIMFSLIYYAFLAKEPYDPINSLFFSMFILLIINPFWIFNLGFQLSFIATFSIIYFTPKLRDFFYLYKGKIFSILYGLLAVHIGLLPVQAYYFNRVSIISILSNLILAPILSLCLVLGASMVLLSFTLPFLNLILGKILNLILSIEFSIVDLLYDIPFGQIKLHSPSIYEFILYYILVFLIFGVIDLRKWDLRVLKAIMYFLISLIVFNSISIMMDKSMEIHFIDVGQGDSILLRTRWDDYLIDTGGNIFDSFDIGKNITLPYLEKLGINRLKAIFISHFDEDHSKALPLLMDNIKVENLIISYEDNGNTIYEEIKSRKVPIIVLKEKDRVNLDTNVYMEVLSPNEDIKNRWKSGNNLSLVLLLNYYDKKLLFTGDIEKEVEWEIKDKFSDTIDIIKVPHHGSNTSSTEELLDIIRPIIGIISVGRNNLFNHPRDEVLERYEKIGSLIYRTDIHGMVKVILNKDIIYVEPFIKDKISLLDYLDENIFAFAFYVLYYLIAYIFIRQYSHYKERLEKSELQGTY